MVFHFYGYSFLVNFFLVFFILGRAVDQAGLTASFRAHVNIVSSHDITSLPGCLAIQTIRQACHTIPDAQQTLSKH